VRHSVVLIHCPELSVRLSRLPFTCVPSVRDYWYWNNLLYLPIRSNMYVQLVPVLVKAWRINTGLHWYEMFCSFYLLSPFPFDHFLSIALCRRYGYCDKETHSCVLWLLTEYAVPHFGHNHVFRNFSAPDEVGLFKVKAKLPLGQSIFYEGV
jgi:hypothetical protein